MIADIKGLPEVVYLPDSSVDDTLDRELRRILATCFTKEGDEIFRERRYFKESYMHRFVMHDEDGRIAAHIGVHEKEIEVGESVYSVGGIGEVCVYGDCRGKGYVPHMLKTVHQWLQEHQFIYAILFGKRDVYQSSGYEQVENMTVTNPDTGESHPVSTMVYPLTRQPWPETTVHLRGIMF